VYLTNVYNLKTGTLIWSGESRTREALAAFFEFSGKEWAANLFGICCDMWPPYIAYDPDQDTASIVDIRHAPYRSATDRGYGQGHVPGSCREGYGTQEYSGRHPLNQAQESVEPD
jgi:hypothetical protein